METAVPLAAEADWFDGQDLRGFTRDSLIGRGSTGAVYLLKNSEDDLAVVKELEVSRMGPKERRQAAQEVRLLSDLSHPNIIAYYGTVFNKRRQVLEIYMEYADRGTLADLIRERQDSHSARGFEEQTVVRWTRQMISAMRCVHQRKIIHRDLKPSNVFVSTDGSIKLADFGVSAELSGTQQEAETVCGTPFYFSPEMVHGQPYSTATDVWSLGVIIWEVLTLSRPFCGSNIMQLAMQIMHKEVDVGALDARAPDVDRRLRHMVLQMLRKEPGQRPTMQQLHDDPSLSERLGMLYLRHAGSGSSAALSDSASRAGSAHSPRELHAASPDGAARAVQAGVRGWRDRQTVRFLRSFADPGEAAARASSPPARPHVPQRAALHVAPRPSSALLQRAAGTAAAGLQRPRSLSAKATSPLSPLSPVHRSRFQPNLPAVGANRPPSGGALRRPQLSSGGSGSFGGPHFRSGGCASGGPYRSAPNSTSVSPPRKGLHSWPQSPVQPLDSDATAAMFAPTQPALSPQQLQGRGSPAHSRVSPPPSSPLAADLADTSAAGPTLRLLRPATASGAVGARGAEAPRRTSVRLSPPPERPRAELRGALDSRALSPSV